MEIDAKFQKLVEEIEKFQNLKKEAEQKNHTQNISLCTQQLLS